MRNICSLALLTLSLVLAGLPACSRDPNAKKQKFFESGNHYFDQGKYSEASIQYLNAIKIDYNFAKAHYKLAETYIRLQDWSDAYRELQRTVAVDPGNVKAQIELGNLLVAGRTFAEAQGIADKVLKTDPNNADAHVLQASLNIAQDNRDAAIQELQRWGAILRDRAPKPA